MAGDGTQTYGPDGSPALGAGVMMPGYLALDAAGGLHFTSGGRVRSLVASPLPAGSVPDGSDAAARPLDVRRLSSGDLSLWWGSSCTSSDNDFIVYEGVLGNWASHAPLLCSTGGATGATITHSAADRYYLIVARNPLREGSLGFRSDGASRPEGLSSCLARLTGAGCP